MPLLETGPHHILLADDDDDDRLLFVDALKELPQQFILTVAGDGEHLMTLLASLEETPDLLFLDLNMPLKNGFECLDEIKQNEKLRKLPVIIFSTSSQPSAIDKTYDAGAHLYIRKPNDFATLRKVIGHVLSLDWRQQNERPAKEEFLLHV